MFCDADDIIEHLFVTCPLVARIWQWIILHNTFTFHVRLYMISEA
jgi:hypothetical protein